MKVNISNFEAYVREETEAILNGEKLLCPEQVMARLGINRRQLQDMHRGENKTSPYLPPVKLGKKTIRYRLRDVLRVEWEGLQRR